MFCGASFWVKEVCIFFSLLELEKHLYEKRLKFDISWKTREILADEDFQHEDIRGSS